MKPFHSDQSDLGLTALIQLIYTFSDPTYLHYLESILL